MRAKQASVASASMICLSAHELFELTGKRKYSAQIRALRFMAIDHRTRPDGSIVVLRSQIAAASAEASAAMESNKRIEPKWG